VSTTNRIIEQSQALVQAIEAMGTIEPIGPIERALAGLLQAAYKRRLRRILGEARKDMDGHISQIMAKIEEMTKAKQKLRDCIKELNAWTSEEMSKHPNAEDMDIQKVTDSSPNKHFKIRGNRIRYNEPCVGGKYADLVGEVEIGYDQDYGDGVTIGGLKSLQEELEGKLDALNEMSEMTALRLQMTMDRRSKTISTLSQMMKKVSATQDTLAQNIK
jgi:hypothetical protein